MKKENNSFIKQNLPNNKTELDQFYTNPLTAKKLTKYEWPKGVISSEQATWSFRPNNEFYEELRKRVSEGNEKFKDKIFVDGQWVERKSDLYVIYSGREPGMFNSWEEFTEYKEGKKPVEKEVDIYQLTSYTKNDLEIATPYLVEIDGIYSSQFKLRNKESWKRELDWLASLWSSKQLEFYNEETKKAFFQEYNDWASK